MLYKKQGFPEDSEIVLCTVLSVHHNAVFILIDEYDKKGVIHISEISPGRIRNIRDYVVEGKKIICKVLRINEERGHIDLSLRRVNEMQKRDKNDQLKHEQKAEKILELACKEAGKDFKQTYEKIRPLVFAKYSTMYLCFEDVMIGNFNLSELKLDEKLTKTLKDIILLRIKPPEVIIKGVLKLQTYAPNGVEIIKETLKKTEAENITIFYAGAGRFNISVKAEEYKKAESDLKRVIDDVTEYMEEQDGKVEFERQEA
ncbi:MAG: translation initiation factor IF-2 subunit alpha [Nanoarchaeota archaeon]|nr:translation initiation factor IF-2 subunit alpha [Nanoarchaeota archaeon]